MALTTSHSGELTYGRLAARTESEPSRSWLLEPRPKAFLASSPMLDSRAARSYLGLDIPASASTQWRLW